jgi:hypothetical protein
VASGPEKPSISPIAQARDSERLAGLALVAERVAASPTKLSSLIIGAAIVGALVVLSL